MWTCLALLSNLVEVIGNLDPSSMETETVLALIFVTFALSNAD